jgi:hypothetical protein
VLVEIDSVLVELDSVLVELDSVLVLLQGNSVRSTVIFVPS